MAVDPENLTEEDLFNLSDEELSQLSSEQIEAITSNKTADPDDDNEEEENNEQDDAALAAASDDDDDDSSDDDDDQAGASDDSDSEEDDSDDDDSEDDESGSSGSGESESEGESEEEESDDELDEQGRPIKSAKSSKSSKSDKSTKNSENTDSTNNTDEDFDYKAAYEQITAPFKANGTEFKINGPDEAIKLMQQGANYGKKMAALQPHLRIVRTLDKEGISSVDDLSFLLDLKNKKPDAIAKLIKDSGIDPLSLDGDDNSEEYKPGNYAVTDQEMALENVLDDVQSSPHYGRLMEVIGKEWDSTSKQVLGQNPAVISIIHDQMANGVFELISTEMHRQKALGGLTGLTDLEAYKQIGDSIQAAGGFDHIAQPQVTTKPPAKKRVPSKSKAEDDKLKQRRKAASPTKGSDAVKKKSLADFNPLNMSDEEFQKQFSSNL